jgi:hypothetical protein
MSSWTTLSDASLTAGKKITAFILRALRDNITAVASGASGAPKITTAAINDLAVTTGKLANGAVTSGKIGAGQVLTSNIGNLQVTTDKIANEEVTTGKIANGSVTAAKLSADAVQSRTAEIAVGAVGSYAFLLNTGSGLFPGDVIVGGVLRYSGTGNEIGSAPPGNWRCMGRVDSSQATLFLRIS